MSCPFDTQLCRLLEELGKIEPSLPDNPMDLARKVVVAFPKLQKTIGCTNMYIIHNNVIKWKCGNVTLFFTRSKREYSKIDILVKRGGDKREQKDGVFFEDFQRIVTSMMKPLLAEYEVGDLDKYKPSTQNKPIEKQKLGTSSSNVKNVASSLASSFGATDGYPDTQKDIVSSMDDKFEDLDKTINTGTFRSAVGDNKIYAKIKKSYADAKKNRNL
jgi:hypothetical protein